MSSEVKADLAIEFVKRRGGLVAQARLAYLLDGHPPSQEAMGALFAGQREDGGWPPPWAAGYSSLDATCFRLAQAEGLGLAAAEVPIARAVRFLLRRQQDHGAWEENEAFTLSAPPWVKPGRRAARLYLTANCGFWLAVFSPAQPGVARAAGYLQSYVDTQGGLPSFLQTYWLAAGLWYRLGWNAPAERLLARLAERLEGRSVDILSADTRSVDTGPADGAPSDKVPAANLAWMLLTLRIAGLPSDHPPCERALALLEAEQREDGSWVGEDGPASDMHTTLEALRALRLFGRF